MKQNFTYKGLARLYFIMRVSTANLIFIFTPCLHTISIASVSGQEIENTYVSISLDHEPLEELLNDIERQTQFMFVFPVEIVRKYNDVTICENRITVKDLLSISFDEIPLSYKVNGPTIVVFKDDKLKLITSNIDVLLQVRGKIVGPDGTPLPGVNVMVKGTNIGVSSDSKGEYLIEVSNDDEILVFSFIGYKSHEENISGRTRVDITMYEDVKSLDEVEIRGTGYWQYTKDRSIGNIAKVDSKEIEKMPISSPLLSLQGRIAGVDVAPYNGTPGNAPKILVRGQNSLRTTGGYPLYVIDGVPVDPRPIMSSSSSLISAGFDPISTINPANIESIQVLKDADATAIYGSRGANGVILIKTKGSDFRERTNLDVSVYQGFGNISKKLDLLNTEQYLGMRREAYKNDGRVPSGFLANDLLLWDTTRYTDWQDVLLGGHASVTDAQCALSGGNSNTSFRLGVGYHKESMILPGDFGYRRLSGQLNVSHRSANGKLNLSTSINYGSELNRLFNDLNFISEGIVLPPNAPNVYDDNGNLNWELNTAGTSTWVNPFSRLMNAHNGRTNNLVINSVISYSPLKNLVIKSNVGVTDLSNREIVRYPIAAKAPDAVLASTTGEVSFGSNYRSTWIVEPQIQYSKFLNDHNFDFLIGSTFQNSNSSTEMVSASGYSSDLLLNSIQGAGSSYASVDDNSQYRYLSFYSRIGYSFKNRYLLSFTGRRDGSSRFGQGNRYGNFGSIGGAWIFLDGSSFGGIKGPISFGKFRVTYGLVGNDQIGDYQYYSTYSINPLKYEDAVTIYPTSLQNRQFAWEVTKKFETGMDFRLFDDRVSFDASWYVNRSSNQLIQYQLPAITGFQDVLKNFDATVENSGLEFNLIVENYKANQFQWITSVNMSVPRNRLVSFPGIKESPYASVYKVDRSLSVMNLYIWDGINSETGTYRFVDKDDDGDIDGYDKDLVGNFDRKLYGGFSNMFRYKSFQLDFLIQYSVGNGLKYLPANAPGTPRNFQSFILERWQEPGDLSEVQLFTTGRNADARNGYNKLVVSDFLITDASFVRLKNLTVSYRLPVGVLERASLKEAMIYVLAQNLFTMSSYDGLDPETGGDALPPIRMITIGLDLKF